MKYDFDVALSGQLLEDNKSRFESFSKNRCHRKLDYIKALH